ncbi:sigma-70 family RNA polymerase sigma factor [Streptomyces albidoflavus]|uniref:RNA polymerase sigma factor n=1 Tax=Streptomyces albidoflavus TaxID=1886 RepID=UPI00340B37CE
MSIVADERVIPVQPVAGLAEEIERQEREDNERGPELEPEPEPGPAGRWSEERRLSRSYLGPGRVDRRVREDVVLSQEDAARLGRLVELYDERLRRWARWSLEYQRDADADDIVQVTWFKLSQRMDTLRGGDDALYPLIKTIAKTTRLDFVSTARRREWAVEDEALTFLAGATEQDETACAVLDLLEGDGPGWAPCYADAIAALPARQREVIEMRCVDGMTTTAIAARLGVAKQSVQYHLRRALAALRPAVGAPVQEGLPEGFERMLHRLPASQQAVVRLMAEGGLTDAEVERRTGYARGAGRKAFNAALRSLRQMISDDQADRAAGTVPQRAASACTSAAKCASGCYLRTGAVAA